MPPPRPIDSSSSPGGALQRNVLRERETQNERVTVTILGNQGRLAAPLDRTSRRHDAAGDDSKQQLMPRILEGGKTDDFALSNLKVGIGNTYHALHIRNDDG